MTIHLIMLAALLLSHRVTSFFFERNLQRKSSHHHLAMMVDNEAAVALMFTAMDASISSAAAVDIREVLSIAANKALNGGAAGASAAAIQVLSLMWLRTAINYQYRFGTSTSEALKTLYKEGGIGRLYQGLPFAIVQGPLSRFGDTAANALVFSLFESFDAGGTVYPLVVRTAAGSIAAGLWRVVLTPVDTAKTCMQVSGKKGLDELSVRVKEKGFGVLFNGALATSVATFVGHFPWFFTFNYLSSHLPSAADLDTSLDPRVLELLRSAFIGLCASSVSDIFSNSIRVLKTARQTAFLSAPSTTASTTTATTTTTATNSTTSIISSKSTDQPLSADASYLALAREIISAEGFAGLFGRGLQTRLLSNALQGMLFSVLYKYFSSAPGNGGGGGGG